MNKLAWISSLLLAWGCTDHSSPLVILPPGVDAAIMPGADLSSVPASPYCRPCSAAAPDCGEGNLCLSPSSGQQFCVTDCSAGQACPTGSTCRTFSGHQVCVPDSLSCSGVVPPPVDGSVAPPPPDGGIASSGDPHLDYALMLINQSRAQHGAAPLQFSATLNACAAKHAKDLHDCAGNSISNFLACGHNDYKAGDTCGGAADRVQAVNYTPEDSGFKQDHDMMMAEGPPPAGSFNHYSTIINPAETVVGIAIYVDGSMMWVSEDFK